MFSFSTCWNSHRHTDGRAMLAEIRALGFEFAELGHGTRASLLDGIQQAVAAGEIKISSVHNFCPLPPGVTGPAPDRYRPSAIDETERRLAIRHTLRSLECAASLGAKAVVLHLGRVPVRDCMAQLLKLYATEGAKSAKFQRLRQKALAARARKQKQAIEQVYRTLDAVVPRAQELGVKLGMETRLAIEEIPNEDEANQIIERFGPAGISYWHDVAHAQMRENLGLTCHEAILEQFAGKTAGMHLQDFAPPAIDHLPPGRGDFEFSRLEPFVTGDMVLAWEIHPRWKADEIRAGLNPVHEMFRHAVSA
jgi:sugar phosphate isomerase/epimerase